MKTSNLNERIESTAGQEDESENKLFVSFDEELEEQSIADLGKFEDEKD
jgi:hypothetical protein